MLGQILAKYTESMQYKTSNRQYIIRQIPTSNKTTEARMVAYTC